jgi:hypothetical protein
VCLSEEFAEEANYLCYCLLFEPSRQHGVHYDWIVVFRSHTQHVAPLVKMKHRLAVWLDRNGNTVCTPLNQGTAVDIVNIARTAGLQILLDARIGRETYHSVSGSLSSLQRFADAVCAAMSDEFAARGDQVEQREA